VLFRSENISEYCQAEILKNIDKLIASLGVENRVSLIGKSWKTLVNIGVLGERSSCRKLSAVFKTSSRGITVRVCE